MPYFPPASAGFANPMTTAGDLITGGVAGAAGRLATGSAGQILGQSGGVPAWVAGGAMTQIAQTVLGATTASVTFSSIPGSYSGLLLQWTLRSSASQSFCYLRLQINGDTAAHYDWAYMAGNMGGGSSFSGASAETSWRIADGAGATSPANYFGTGDLIIPQYAATTAYKNAVAKCLRPSDNTSAFWSMQHVGTWRSAAAITSLVLFPDSGSWIAGTTFTLYGLQ